MMTVKGAVRLLLVALFATIPVVGCVPAEHPQVTQATPTRELTKPPEANSAKQSQEKIRLQVFVAGSLLIPFDRLEKAYEQSHSNVDVQVQGHGSIQVVRHVTEIHEEIDMVAVADHSLIPMLMYQTQMPDGTGPYADWTVDFAHGKLGLAYRPDSAYAGEIDNRNWYEVLARPDVLCGFADPRFDASGYRSFMLIKLAEDYYADPTIFSRLVASSFGHRVRVNCESGVCTILVPELLEATMGRVLLRGFSIQLLSLLESGNLDYAFEYESVARQHGLKFLELPPEIDFSSAQLSDRYSNVVLKTDYRRFASVDPVFRGEPIVYGLTVPKSAPNPEAAAQFVEFILSNEGQTILSEALQPPIVPPRVDHAEMLPQRLKRLVSP